jgi:hypothetical protein
MPTKKKPDRVLRELLETANDLCAYGVVSKSDMAHMKLRCSVRTASTSSTLDEFRCTNVPKVVRDHLDAKLGTCIVWNTLTDASAIVRRVKGRR